jgi:hypothetical protein
MYRNDKIFNRDNFSPNFKLKICQKFEISQPEVINYLLDVFCLANFKYLTDFKFKIRVWPPCYFRNEFKLEQSGQIFNFKFSKEFQN